MILKRRPQGQSELCQRRPSWLMLICVLLLLGVLLSNLHLLSSSKPKNNKELKDDAFGYFTAAKERGEEYKNNNEDADGGEKIIRRKMGLIALKNRGDIGGLLEHMGFEVGVEVGVQRGHNSRTILHRWKSCKEYHLVDVWSHQELNYVDKANVDDEEQNEYMEEAKSLLRPYEGITTFHKMLSTEAAKLFANSKNKTTFDFVYIDARHDYCGVTEDIEAYWPLVRPGGILAGHDYLTNAIQQSQGGRNKLLDDFGLCMDGTRNERAVRGAVEDFAMKNGLTITVMYDEGHIWKSWMVQKPGGI